ncbi:transposase, IS605 OrfB family [Caldicellulosiruptor kronotskyensis 2002]|uniref:Transposase, IS605 OrfB family n=1 Tax=Caldicellulosiruptor kronotskyensis (strain DSM 18902 / VKM B-2412 / 2002) TaxID=632348 RepID=E4SER5_CALK2|nr:RNA-guided endonuclease TnpB family protein [Caldicellulosiruptor kronotskyensis]ADQ45552.1 transposase, IS605 OrfB family [Caldicellulosiruptor kronotskyensis 2002]ADQ45585.1 transposase, IS605 OrfB family [Caldicellulosiruptor kronotskyensis 2002]
MYKTQKNHIRCDKQTYKLLRYLCHFSKNLYNYALYYIRQHYFKTQEYLRYESVYHLVKDSEDYRLLPSQVAQQTLISVDEAFKSFLSLLKAKKEGKVEEKVSMPKYLPKDGMYQIVFSKDQFKTEGKKVRLSLGRSFAKEFGVRYLYFDLPATVLGKKIKEVRIVPRFNGRWFEIEYVYEEEQQLSIFDLSRCLAIDLGLDNFAAVVDTIGTAFLIEGRFLKSVNRWYNKERARLQSIYSRQGIKCGRKLALVSRKRQHIIDNFLNQAVSLIIKHCLNNQIGAVVVGRMKGIKQGIEIGRVNNQNFVGIPYDKFKRKLKSKCMYYGIRYMEVDEGYTSQRCSRCGHVSKSSRKYRGLYVCKKCGYVVNADINGAINIVAKVAGESAVKQITSSGCVNHPVRIRVA